MELYKNFLTLAKNRFSPKSYGMIKEATRMAVGRLSDLQRYDGKPLVYHSVGVAIIVIRDIGLGRNTTIAALLHDAYRMGRITDEEICAAFGHEIIDILTGMNNISKVVTNTDHDQIEHFKELIVSYSSNPRIILLKLADRMEVMQSLEAFPPEKRIKKSWESLHIYSQIAHKLGLYSIKSDMEDLSLKYLEPEDYELIRTKLEATASQREDFIARFTAPISQRLESHGIRFHIKGRTKSVYSIWRKMNKQHVSFEEVYDVFAIRIIIDCPHEQEKAQCWLTYSVVTDIYKPNTERLRDWISIPKSNGYESLHTTVVTEDGRWVEVQIRTERMDEVAERGVAAHWRYKGVEGGDLTSAQWLERMREVMDSVTLNPYETVSFESDLALTSKEIFVFTPNGDLRKLPLGATILDFAYDIHSDLGNRCVGGKVNHKNVTIREQLKNGDLVEITTAKNQKPRADWLNIVVTSKAKSRIKSYIREEEKKEALIGKEELERKLKNWKIGLDLEESTNVLCHLYKAKNGVELYNKIARDEIDMLDIKEALTRHAAGEEAPALSHERKAPKTPAAPKTHNDALIVDRNLHDLKYRFANCCNPVYGDPIFGFVTVLNGITIHRQDCVNGKSLRERYPYRVLEARWRDAQGGGLFSVQIEVESDDVMGLEYSFREVLNALNIDLRSISTRYEPKSVVSVITIMASSPNVVESVLYMLKQIDGVHKARIAEQQVNK